LFICSTVCQSVVTIVVPYSSGTCNRLTVVMFLAAAVDHLYCAVCACFTEEYVFNRRKLLRCRRSKSVEPGRDLWSKAEHDRVDR